MDEQTDKQTANPEETTGAEASATATGSAPDKAGATMTPEAIQKAFRDNPELLKQVKIPAKLEGKEVEIPIANTRDDYQIRTVSMSRMEQAALKEKDIERREAKLAEQGDPFKRFMDEYAARQKPPQPETPLEGLDFANDPFTATPQLAEVTRELYKRNKTQEAKLTEYEKKLPELEKLAKSAIEAQRNYEIRVNVEADFEKARRHNPDFTGRLVVDPQTGKFLYDYGERDTITETAIRLANSEKPDPRLDGKAGARMDLCDIVDALSADEARRHEAKKVAVAAEKKARLKNLASVAQAGAVMPEAPPKTTILPTDDAKTIKEKTALIRREIQEQMTADGISG